MLGKCKLKTEFENKIKQLRPKLLSLTKIWQTMQAGY